MKSTHLFVLAVLGTILMGCASARKINRISVGMPKDDVISLMGRPASTSATGGVEYLNYALSETGDDAFYGRTTPYYVRIIDGKVDSYGRHGDFDSTKENTQVIKIQAETKSDDRVSISNSGDVEDKLLKLKTLHSKELITKEEFELRKKQILDEFAGK